MGMFGGYYAHANRTHRRAQVPGVQDTGQWMWEIEELAHEFAALEPSAVLEVGSYQGGSLWYWCHYALAGTHIITIDDSTPADPTWRDWLPVGVEHTHIIADSQDPETLERVQQIHPRLDFVFIDADHTEQGATRDFELYGPIVRRGGIIAFHDILNPAPHRLQDHIRVSRLWKRIVQAGYKTRQLIADPHQEWGGIGVVYV